MKNFLEIKLWLELRNFIIFIQARIKILEKNNPALWAHRNHEWKFVLNKIIRDGIKSE